LALLSSLLVLSGPARAAPGGAEKAEQARAVFRKHCLGCHGAVARGGVRLLDRELLLRRKLVLPELPAGSLLLDLVDGGSMPPGKLRKASAADRAALREWVRAGAPGFPAEVGREYLLGRLAADFDRLPQRRKPHARYVSFNHLPPGDNAARAAALAAVLGSLTAGKQVRLEKVEPTGTLLRLDLEELGWDRRPFTGEKKPFAREKLTVFDLVLLEYPYAVLRAAPFPAGLAAFLVTTAQARPVPYVRGDWLARAVSHPPLRGALLQALGKPTGAAPPAKALFPGARVGWDDAVRELETAPERKPLEAALRSLAALKPLAEGRTVEREAWERNFPRLAARLGGLSLVPIDGLSWTDYEPDPRLKVSMRLIDPKDPGLPDNPEPKDRLVAGKGRLAIWIRASQAVFLELLIADDAGKMTLLSRKDYLLEANRPLVVPAKNPPKTPGKRFLILYAYPASGLGAAPYPGKKAVLEGKYARFIHPLYPLTADGKDLAPPDSSSLLKITLPFRIVSP
jgi:mono/diheme cytochrome c family protein